MKEAPTVYAITTDDGYIVKIFYYRSDATRWIRKQRESGHNHFCIEGPFEVQ